MPVTSRIVCIPRDMEDGDSLYQPLPHDHFSVEIAMSVMTNIATQIERIIGSKEPYEISLLGLRNSLQDDPQPVLTVGIARPDRIEKVLPSLDIPFIVHLCSYYPTSFSNGADRNPRPEQYGALQQDVPPVGSSCGLLADDRHSVSLGSYVHLSSAPKKTFILTAPLNLGSNVLVMKGNTVTQPSVADRDHINASEDRYWRDVLKKDREQAAALATRRAELEETFELARTISSASGVQLPPEPPKAQFDTVWDGSQAKKAEIDISLANPSDSWAIVEVTRATTLAGLSSANKRKIWPFKGGPHIHARVHALVPGLIVSKRGRTTGRTIGTVNGVKSLYRLPRDGNGIRRYDYPVLSYPYGATFGLPGDAGAVVMAQQKEDIEDNKVKHTGKPCALIVACSTSGHLAFVQDIESVIAGVKRAELGNLSFVELDG